MNVLRFEPLEVLCAPWAESRLPSLYPLFNVQIEKCLNLDEDDEVFWDVGRISTLLPYTMQSLYGRERHMCTVESAVLENEYLKAVFLPDMGGRLWSLYDKVGKRDLLYTNDCIQPCNLALRNAWMSGGVEWNPSMIGHGPYTCSRIGTARLHTEKYGEVLRFYAFERIREIVYQMDFMLPAGSKVLLARMRIKNTHPRTIPMYWFSNMAVPQTPGCRVVVNAKSSYHSGVGYVGKTTFPLSQTGMDWSNPYNSVKAADFFYKIPDAKRKYIAYYDKDGHGMFQTSTARQKGRKLFVWGQNRGAASWQKWLTDKAGEYMEIQAGINRTQYECIPMPPNVAWEWVEAYGAADLPSAVVHGDFHEACVATEQMIEQVVGEQWLEDFLLDTKVSVALKPADEVFGVGEDSGWGALENARRRAAGEPEMEPHLDFGGMSEAQTPWLSLLEKGELITPENDGGNCMISAKWTALLDESLKKGKGGWYAYYQRGIMAFSEQQHTEAIGHFTRSQEIKETAWNHYGLAMAHFALGDEQCLGHICAAMKMMPECVELGRECVNLFLHFERYEELVDFHDTFSVASQTDGYIRCGYAMALAKLGRYEEAEAILYADGGLQIVDQREGENHIAELWYSIEEAKATRNGVEFDRKYTVVPQQFQFSMSEVAD